MEDDEIKKELLESYRKQRCELTPLERVILNSLIIAGITFFSSLSVAFPPRPENLWAALIGASLALFTQLKEITSMSEEYQKPKRPLGMLI